MRLTDKYVANLTAAEGTRIEIPDDLQPGLRIRVTDKGVKSWSVQRRINGRKRRFTIGPYPEISLSEARKRAARLLVQAADGYDPVAERRKQQADRSQGKSLTLDQVIEAYSGQIAERTRYQTTKASVLRRELKPVLKKRIDELTSIDLVSAVDRKAASAPTSANRLVAVIKVFTKWMAQRGYTGGDIGLNLIKPLREIPRDRVLTTDELKAVWRVCRELGYPFGPLIRLLILTGQRRDEVAHMKWGEIDLQTRLWSVPGERTKNRQPHVVPLSDLAVAELEGLAAICADRSDGHFVFSTTGTTPVSGFSKVKARVDRFSGVANWRLHDLRRTMVSYMVDEGVDALVADRILNHIGSSTMGTVQRVYQKSQMLNQRRQALQGWGHYLESLTNDIEPTG